MGAQHVTTEVSTGPSRPWYTLGQWPHWLGCKRNEKQQERIVAFRCDPKLEIDIYMKLTFISISGLASWSKAKDETYTVKVWD